MCAVAGLAQSPQASPTPRPVQEESRECTQARATVTRLETRLKDWPALARYREDNAKRATPSKREKRVVFMGRKMSEAFNQPAKQAEA
jgi:acyl-CoA thioesterase I